MKKCSFCGASNFDVNIVCEKCKQPFVDPFIQNEPKSKPRRQKRSALETPCDSPKRNSEDSTQQQSSITTSGSVPVVHSNVARKAAKFFLLLETVVRWLGFLIFAVLWIVSVVEDWLLVPIVFFVAMMAFLGYAALATLATASYSKKVACNAHINLGFKICTLFFFSTIAGILMLCE